MAEGNEIDLVKYGVLWQKVQDMDKKVDKMERNVEELLALAKDQNVRLQSGWVGRDGRGGLGRVPRHGGSHARGAPQALPPLDSTALTRRRLGGPPLAGAVAFVSPQARPPAPERVYS